MGYQIWDYLSHGMEGYVTEFYFQVIIGTILIFTCGQVISSRLLGTLCDNRTGAQILLTKKEIKKQRKLSCLAALILIVAMVGAIAVFGIMVDSFAVTTWIGALILVSDIVYLLIAFFAYRKNHSMNNKIAFSFVSLLLVGFGVMVFGIMDISYSVRLKHLVLFGFLIIAFVIFEYAMFIFLIDRPNELFRYARGYFEKTESDAEESVSDRHDKVFLLSNGKRVRVKRFNIYGEDELQKEEPLPDKLYIYYVQNGMVFCGEHKDSTLSEKIYNIPLSKVMRKTLHQG